MRNLLTFIDKTLKSVKFSVILMLLIALASIYGTVFPAKGPYDFNLYKTPYFIALLFLFALNLLYCTLFRVFKQIKGKYKIGITGRETFHTEKSIEQIKEALKNKGYKIFETDYGLIAKKGILRYTSIILIHISIILILIFAGLSNMTGFLGTVNVHVGDETEKVFDWEEKEDIKIPFRIYAENLFIDYYPIDVKILVEDINSGEKREFITKEGKVIIFSGRTIKVEKVDLQNFYVYFKTSEIGNEIFKNEDLNSAIRIKLKAYMDPVIRQYYCDLTLKDSGKEIVRKRVSINNPLIYGDYRFYLIETGKDPFGFDYVGFQITKEPFINFIWLGSILLCLSLIFYPFLKESYVKVYKETKGIKITLYNEKNFFEEEN